MDLYQQPFASRLSWLEQLAERHSHEFIASSGQRSQYLQQHPTKLIALKCMDGRIHLPHATQTPLGIIQPYRNLGGIFDLGWPYLGDMLCDDINQALAQGRPVLVLISYHFSAGARERGCAGFQHDRDAALAQAQAERGAPSSTSAQRGGGIMVGQLADILGMERGEPVCEPVLVVGKAFGQTMQAGTAVVPDQRMGDGVMTVGIPVGFGVILFTIVITAIYVRRANSEFDDLSHAIITEVHK